MVKDDDLEAYARDVDVDWEHRYFRLEQAARAAMVFLKMGGTQGTIGANTVALSPTYCRQLAGDLARALEP